MRQIQGDPNTDIGTTTEPTYLLLGTPAVARPSGRPTIVGGTLQARLLSILLLRAGNPVPTEALIRGLWERPPVRAANALQAHVTRLRGFLGGCPLGHEPGGYLLDVRPESIDVHVLKTAVDRARRQLVSGDHALALETVERALTLWRGTPLAAFGDVLFAVAERTRLCGLRLDLLVLRAESELGLHQHSTAVASLQLLVHANPLREDLWELLLVALQRSGRVAEALAAYQQMRTHFAHELGIEPGPHLRERGTDLISRARRPTAARSR